jgi:hypothetical protein
MPAPDDRGAPARRLGASVIKIERRGDDGRDVTGSRRSSDQFQ